MFITYVNKLCQKHSRVAFLLIGAVIIVPFIFIWGSPRDFLRGDRWRGNKVGDMYGHAISRDAFMWQRTAADMTYFLRTGQLLSQQPKAQGAWHEEALQRLRALREAKKRGLQQVSDAEVAKSIQTQFARNGVFDPALFAAFRENVLARQQIDGPRFDDITRENIIIARLDAQVTAGVFVSPEEARQMFDLFGEKYTVAVARFTAADCQKQAEAQPLPPDAAPAYYAEHVEQPFRERLKGGKTPEDLLREEAAKLREASGKTDEQKSAEWQAFQDSIENNLIPYFVPEQKRDRVAVFALEKYRDKAKVDEERVKAYYEEKKNEYSTPTVRAREILFRVPGTATPEQKAAKRKSLEGLRQMIAGGIEFAVLAKQFSEDPESKEKGGDLGYFSKGMEVEAVEKAAFALDKGGVSEVVESPLGLHLIQVVDKRGARSLADVHDEIEKTLRDAETAKLAATAAQTFGDDVFKALDLKVNEKRRPADVFSEMAGQAHVEVIDSAWFRADSRTIDPFGAEPELLRQAIKLTPQRPLTETVNGENRCFVACWLDTKPASLPQIDKDPAVAQTVGKRIYHEKAVGLARDKAAAAFAKIEAKLSAGTAFATAKDDVAFEDVPEFSRQQPPMQFPDAQVVVEAAAGSKPGQFLGPVATADGAVLILVKTRTAPTDEEFQKARVQIEQQLKRQKEMVALRTFNDKLKAESRTVLAEGWRTRSGEE